MGLLNVVHCLYEPVYQGGDSRQGEDRISISRRGRDVETDGKLEHLISSSTSSQIDTHT